MSLGPSISKEEIKWEVLTSLAFSKLSKEEL